MKIIQRKDVEMVVLPGRVIQKVVGRESFCPSNRMTMGFATYSAEYGPMDPHRHAEEICYILSSKDGRLRHGSDKDKLGAAVPLQTGVTLHIPPLEWHVFEYGPGGHVDIIFFYGQVESIRPEEIEPKR
jgi:hypothetical protein